jgi:hypothetical protein
MEPSQAIAVKRTAEWPFSCIASESPMTPENGHSAVLFTAMAWEGSMGSHYAELGVRVSVDAYEGRCSGENENALSAMLRPRRRQNFLIRRRFYQIQVDRLWLSRFHCSTS